MYGTVSPGAIESSLRAAFDLRMEEILCQVSHPVVRSVLAEALQGGKRVRPFLTCLACEAAGGNAADALDAGLAVELLHVASLVHDDIMDDSSLRRGKPTVQAAHGVPVAVLSGDLLLALALRLIQRNPSPRRDRMTALLTGAFLDLCDGQASDLLPRTADHTSQEDHRMMVEQKTARLVEAAAAIGALVATEDPPVVRALGTFGFHLGMAYQAQDDLLDHVGTEEETGKSVGTDARNGRQTFLTLAYPKTDPVAYISSLVRSHTDEACHALSLLPPSQASDALRGLALSLIQRRR